MNENTRTNKTIQKDVLRPIVVLAAGGKGTRIQSLNSTVPKPMLMIAGKPILQWEIECLVRQGFTDIYITVSHLAEKITSYFGDGKLFGCKISYYYEEQPLGNAGALFKLWEKNKLTDNFFFFISDAIYELDLERFLDFHKKTNAIATLIVHPSSHCQDSSIVFSDKNRTVTNWLNKEDKKPKWYKNSANAGLQILTTELLGLSGINPKAVGSGRGLRKVDLDRDVLKPLISTGRMKAYSTSEYIHDAGTPERFKMVEEDIKSGLAASRNLKYQQKAIFLERDGTVNKYVGSLIFPFQFEMIDGVTEAVKLINSSGYLAIVVANRPDIARDEITIDELNLVHNKMETMLGKEGAYIDGLYYYSHNLDKGFEGEDVELGSVCDYRKPEPFIKAARDFNIDLSKSWMIGVDEQCIQVGKNAGCNNVLIISANGTDGEKSCADYDYFGQDLTVKSLLEAVKLILSKK